MLTFTQRLSPGVLQELACAAGKPCNYRSPVELAAAYWQIDSTAAVLAPSINVLKHLVHSLLESTESQVALDQGTLI